MIEYRLAEVIANNTSLQLGVDLFADHLPDDIEHGVWVNIVKDTYEYSAVNVAKVNIFISYDSYKKCRELADEITSFLKEYLGVSSQGSFSCGGHIELINFGQNLQGDFLIALVSDVYYNEN